VQTIESLNILVYSPAFILLVCSISTNCGNHVIAVLSGCRLLLARMITLEGLLNFSKELNMNHISVAVGFTVWLIRYVSSMLCSFFSKYTSACV
jgi:uncharacterized membrane protein YecN with MAPEG domain